MTAEEVKSILINQIELMKPNERAELVSKLYKMHFIDRRYARKLLGINEEEYQERVTKAWYSALEDSFDSERDFLVRKYNEIMKDCGEFRYE